AFLRVYGAKDGTCTSDEVERLFRALKEARLLGENDIGRNPYWVKMLIEGGLLTLNRGRLFEHTADMLLRRVIESRRQPNLSIVPLEVEMQALGSLALAMHSERRIGFAGEPGWKAALTAIQRHREGLRYKAEDVLDETHGATLVRRQLGRRVEFSHQLVQEFYVAYTLQDEGWRDAAGHADDPWWRETLLLLGGVLAGGGNEQNKGSRSWAHFVDFVGLVLGDGSNEE